MTRLSENSSAGLINHEFHQSHEFPRTLIRAIRGCKIPSKIHHENRGESSDPKSQVRHALRRETAVRKPAAITLSIRVVSAVTQLENFRASKICRFSRTQDPHSSQKTVTVLQGELALN